MYCVFGILKVKPGEPLYAQVNREKKKNRHFEGNSRVYGGYSGSPSGDPHSHWVENSNSVSVDNLSHQPAGDSWVQNENLRIEDCTDYGKAQVFVRVNTSKQVLLTVCQYLHCGYAIAITSLIELNHPLKRLFSFLLLSMFVLVRKNDVRSCKLS